MTARIAFLGSPEFAVPSLEAVLQHFEVVLVVTQPDRPAGRGRKLEPTPVRRAANARDLPVLLYARRERATFEARLCELAVDVLVVVAFGHILKASTLGAVPHGAVNVHASLLPRWRGVAPIERALWAGDETTGTSLMVLDEGVDTGPVLARESLSIDPGDTRVTLTARLARLGADLLSAHLDGYIEGRIRPVAQPAAGATYAPRLEKSEGRLDWSLAARALERQVRALYEWPGAFTTLAGASLKVHRARAVDSVHAAPPGTLLEADGRTGVWVACGAGKLELVDVQIAGRSRVRARDLVAGRVFHPGQVLGS